MLFDPLTLLNDPLPILATLFIIMVGKSAAAFLIVRAFGHPTGTALMISASLAQIGEFSFILAELGVKLNLLPEQGRDLILVGAILSILLNPLAFAAAERMKSYLDRGAANSHPSPSLKAPHPRWKKRTRPLSSQPIKRLRLPWPAVKRRRFTAKKPI